MTRLIEFKNHQQETLRGLLDKANSSVGIIFIHGMANTTIEKKFKLLVDQLKNQHNLLRFDFSGCGLSDGDFSNFTVKKSAKELSQAIQIFINKTGVKKIILVGHSLGGAIITYYFKKHNPRNIKKAVLLAPALNQKELLRYYFVKMSNRDKKITWQNYRKFLNEKAFQRSLKNKRIMLKEDFLSNKYLLENYNLDYSEIVKKLDADTLIVHGDSDDKVPLTSNNLKPNIIVKGGDHDLSRPDMVKQWLNKTIKFINK